MLRKITKDTMLEDIEFWIHAIVYLIIILCTLKMEQILLAVLSDLEDSSEINAVIALALGVSALVALVITVKELVFLIDKKISIENNDVIVMTGSIIKKDSVRYTYSIKVSSTKMVVAKQDKCHCYGDKGEQVYVVISRYFRKLISVYSSDRFTPGVLSRKIKAIEKY